MKIDVIPVGMLQTNCYVVSDEAKHCAVIDPGDEPDRIIDFLDDNDLTCEVILLTHGHFDHIGGLDSVQRATGAKVVIGEGDRNCIKTSPDQIAQDGEVIACGSLRFTVIETPGHTPGGVCYQCENALFSGDTLFRDSVGRTDFVGGSFDVLRRSLIRLRDLPAADLDVYPGHMEATTLAYERAHNPFIER